MQKKSKKYSIFIIFACFLLLFASSTFALPQFLKELKHSFFEFGSGFAGITGRATTGTTGLSITVQNLPPNVSAIAPLVTNFNTSITEFGITNLSISFLATDVDGVDSLNDASARVNLTTVGDSTVRSNSSCGQAGSDINSTTANYSCLIPIAYFDPPGNWTITVSISDVGGPTMAQNQTNVTLLSTLAIQVGPSSLTFPTISPGATNVTSSNDPVAMNNTGNQNVTINDINVTAYSLVGATSPGYNISAANFTVETITGAFNPECNASTPALVNGTTRTVSNAILPRGNNSIGNGAGNGVELLYVCLRSAPPATLLPSQSYSATGGTAWLFSVI